MIFGITLVICLGFNTSLLSLETKTELLRDRYQQVKSLPKGDRRLALKSAEKAAGALISHVDTHVGVIRVSNLAIRFGHVVK